MATIPNIVVFAGTRPQLIKSAALFNAWRQGFQDLCLLGWVHTGQHYDSNMSEVFLKELDLPVPLTHFELDRSKDSMGQLTEMMHLCYAWLSSQKPSIALVFGDTNSTLAAALAAVRKNLLLKNL